MAKSTNLKYFIPSLIWMIVIFVFSSQNASESTQSSSYILDFLQQLPILNSLHADTFMLIIRKSAHIIEYGILCLTLIYGFFKVNKNYYYTYPILISCLYAMTDEFHQLFVDGRSGSIIDVCIDTFGAILVALFILIINKFKKSTTSKN